MNHKRKGPKPTRAGCLMCKPWKLKGSRREPALKASERRAAQRENDD